MRKALIAVAVASALFAVGAFAASFALNAEDVASGTDLVTECADLVDVDFTTVYDEVADAGDWNVTAAKLTFYDETTTPGTFALTTDCDGYGAAVVIQTAGDTSAAEGEVTSITGSDETVSLVPATVKASAVTSAAVLVDGMDLQVATGGGGI
jgi:hypothetical protein